MLVALKRVRIFGVQKMRKIIVIDDKVEIFATLLRISCYMEMRVSKKVGHPLFFAEKSELRQVQTFLFALKFVS
jgi:hypothetical protein